MIIPVILAGGSGTRLWPLSRKLYPKQVLPLLGEHTLIQETSPPAWFEAGAHRHLQRGAPLCGGGTDARTGRKSRGPDS